MPAPSRARRLADAFLGRPPAAPEAPQPWYTPEQIAQRLCALPDHAFDTYVFAREPMSGKLTPDQQRALAEQARRCGRETAHKLRDRYPADSVAAICEKEGMVVRRQPQPQDGGRVLYAQFVQPNEITVFTHCLSTAAQFARSEGPLACLQPAALEPVLLAHELFHAVEEREPDLFSSAYRLPLWQLGPFHHTTPVLCLSEIAGMAFAKALTALAFCPYALDALLLYGYDAAGACAVCDEITTEEGNPIC